MGDMRHILEDLFTEEECRDLVGWARTEGFEEADMNSSSGTKVDKSYRDNGRAFFESEAFAGKVYSALKERLDLDQEGWEFYTVNPRFRIYEYKPGQKFAMHTDSSYVKNDKDKSFYSFIMYLSDDFTGGKTKFFGMEDVEPKKGKAIVFLQHLMHSGEEVKTGIKYAIRSDLMFRRD